ncbi:MAG: UMP kinase [Opitutaceae bacterium]|nr:UMP kinase [Opitutaceae bacterium]
MPSKPADSQQVKYKRIILKLSGEVLRSHETGDPIDWKTLERICRQIKEIHELGVEVGIVIGGGNIFRGISGTSRGVDRTTGDYMGMLATVINGLAFMECLEKMGVVTRVQTSIPMEQVAEPFIMRRAVRHLEKKRVVIFVAGTGNPYFSTDTAAALRASEIGAQALMKATKVDGVYDKDPAKHKDAVKYENLSYIDALKQRLNVLDSTAFSLCLDNSIPIIVFNLNQDGAIKRAVLGEKVGFYELDLDEDLGIHIPERLHDPAHQDAMRKVLVPPPVTKSDEIVAAMGGMYYNREAPDLPHFVDEGDHFEKGQTLYIIEVMKMFNKVQATFSGTIRGLYVRENGVTVRKGQPLFHIVPDEQVVEEDPEALALRVRAATDGYLERLA